MIATPLRALDCCLISDGAVAYVVTSLERARNLPHAPAVVAGVGVASLDVTLTSIFTQKPSVLSMGSALSGPLAFQQAGLTPADIDVTQIYDCFSITMILQLEDLGFCSRGEGFAFAADGRIAPGGSFPLNTNGGHLSYAYIPGMNHIVEATRQLRGQRGPAQVADAEVALVAALGGNDHATMILTKDR
jgi:acetyl-CoA acetyltransferase